MDFSFDRRKSTQSVQELLAAAQEQLNLKPSAKKYDDPYRQTVLFQFLTDSDIPVGNLRNFYLGENGGLESNEEMYIIVHGHGSDKGCAAPYICHVARWKPSANFHPKFIENVYKKWPNLEEKVSSNPTGVPQSNELSNFTFG